MKLELYRQPSTELTTLGELYVDGKLECMTLEDPVRNEKIPKRTAIPAGRYDIDLTFSPKFGRLMPLILNVPNFKGIRIHTGNSAADTDGCILVGKGSLDADTIFGSRDAYQILFDKLFAADQRKEPIILEVYDAA